jgi:RNA polymerase sigma factor (TIGR02999 family)
LLAEIADGKPEAADALFPLIYDELRNLAAFYLQRERPDHTLQPTALVHEAYMRLVRKDRAGWKDKAHFSALAAMAIRRVLVDHARKRKSLKRGRDWQRVTLTDVSESTGQPIDIIALDHALTKLSGLHDRQARVVMLRYFAGLSLEETASVLDVNRSTVTDDWAVAKAWLATELAGETR